MGDVVLLARRVGDDEQVGADIGDDEVVENAARIVGQHRVAHAAGSEPRDVARHQRLERPYPVVAADRELSHMRNVEQRSGASRVQMLLDDAAGILDRHIVSGERRHPGAELPVQTGQRGRFRRRGFGLVHRDLHGQHARVVRRAPPLSVDLRDSRNLAVPLTPSVEPLPYPRSGPLSRDTSTCGPFA